MRAVIDRDRFHGAGKVLRYIGIAFILVILIALGTLTFYYYNSIDHSKLQIDVSITYQQYPNSTYIKFNVDAIINSSNSHTKFLFNESAGDYGLLLVYNSSLESSNSSFVNYFTIIHYLISNSSPDTSVIWNETVFNASATVLSSTSNISNLKYISAPEGQYLITGGFTAFSSDSLAYQFLEIPDTPLILSG